MRYYCSPRDNISTRHIVKYISCFIKQIILYKCGHKRVIRHCIFNCHPIKDLSHKLYVFALSVQSNQCITYIAIKLTADLYCKWMNLFSCLKSFDVWTSKETTLDRLGNCWHKNVAMWSTHSKPDNLDGVSPKICLALTQERSVSGQKACQSIWPCNWQKENNQ